jgi:hypothetical protein
LAAIKLFFDSAFENLFLFVKLLHIWSKHVLSIMQHRLLVGILF